MHGGVLERLQGRSELERLSKLLHTRRIGVEVIVVVVITTNGVVLQAAMQVEKRALSAAANSREIGQLAAYPTEVRVVFVLRRSAMICAPSAFSSL